MEQLGRSGLVSVEEDSAMQNHEAIEVFYADYLNGQDSMVTVFEVHRDGLIGAVTFIYRNGQLQTYYIGVRWKEGRRYGISKYVKEDSAAYLKNWLDSLRQSPDYIRTTLLDVKKASAMITESLEKVSLENDMKNVVNEKEGKALGKNAEVIAARQTEAKSPRDMQYGIYSVGVGSYVSYVSNPLVSFGNEQQALRFDTKEQARGAARVCKMYMPEERFNVREMPRIVLDKSVPDSRLSDLSVEYRGESRLPWLSGKVDGEPVVAEPLSPRELREYTAGRLSLEQLGLSHFEPYLSRSAEEQKSMSYGR